MFIFRDTGASVLQKKCFQNFFQAISKKDLQQFFFRRKWSSKNFFQAMRKPKKGLRKFSARFLALSNKISTVQKIVLSSNRRQGNFGGLEASRPRPRTSKCVLEDVFEAKDVLEDSTSAIYTSQENPSATFLQSLHSILARPFTHRKKLHQRFCKRSCRKNLIVYFGPKEKKNCCTKV